MSNDPRLGKYVTIAGIDTKGTRKSPNRFRDYFCVNHLVNDSGLFTMQRIVNGHEKVD